MFLALIAHPQEDHKRHLVYVYYVRVMSVDCTTPILVTFKLGKGRYPETSVRKYKLSRWDRYVVPKRRFEVITVQDGSDTLSRIVGLKL
jgi:hypothetical protein